MNTIQRSGPNCKRLVRLSRSNESPSEKNMSISTYYIFFIAMMSRDLNARVEDGVPASKIPDARVRVVSGSAMIPSVRLRVNKNF